MPSPTEARIENPTLAHFIDLAINGQRPGSSTGEKRSARLAQCVLENIPCLDGAAIEGLTQFIELAKYAPESARRLIGQ